MANESKDDKAGAPALDDVKTEREADAAGRAREAGAGNAAAGAAAVPSPGADSPKPHGDKLENAVRKAADAPSEEQER